MPHATKSNILFELSLIDKTRGPAVEGIFKSIFLNQGIDSREIVESNDGLIGQASVYFASQPQAQGLKLRLSRLKLKGIAVGIRRLYKKDWQEKWKENFKQFHLTGRIDVVPAWQKAKYKPTARKALFIDTTSAFGSGLHETTRFMAGLIEENLGANKHFLDIGTGTGILMLVALYSGAKSVHGIDIDKYSVATAHRNFAHNGINTKNLKVADIGKLKGRHNFDFVAANLITLELIRLKGNILSFVAPGGYLAVSGISLENLPHLKRAFNKLPLRTVKIVEGKEWAAVLYQRRR